MQYRGVAAPSRVQVSEEPVVTEIPKVRCSLTVDRSQRWLLELVTGFAPECGERWELELQADGVRLQV